MVKYIPFLKYKSNEIIALGELDDDVSAEVTPFFDYPKPKGDLDIDFFVRNVEKMARSVGKHLEDISELYLDNYDLSEDFSVEDKHSYQVLLESISALNVIPVVSVDRSAAHIQSVISLKNQGILSSSVIAVRLTVEDFESFQAISDELEEYLGPVFELFETVDLIFDCRLSTNLNAGVVSANIARFSSQFSSDYPVRRKVVTGSSIPASVSDVLPVDQECFLERKELIIYRAVRNQAPNQSFMYGDYATISPNYSDVSLMPELMQNVITAKLVYTVDAHHYFIRGGALKAKGAGQYFDLAEELCSKDFFRGEGYSAGDTYFAEKSRREGKNCTPATIVKPSVNAHITFIIKDAPI